MTDESTKELEFFTNEAEGGESLADRLAHGSLPAEEALRYSIEIGAALNRAHKRGAVHGKLSAHSILLVNSHARIVRPVEGTDLDSLPYRAPEVITGSEPDWRSDIFSYGALMYEMVSGRRAFTGEGPALEQSILERPPAALMGKSPIHAAMEGVIAGCIEKDPIRRRQRAQNAVIELKLAGRSLTRLAEYQPVKTVGQPGMEPVDVRPKRPKIFAPIQFPDEIQAVPYRPGRQRLLMAGVFLCALAVIAGIVWLGKSFNVPVIHRYLTPQAGQVVKFQVEPPENTIYRVPSVSPDGRYVVVQSAGPDGKPMLWLRPLDRLEPERIPGTEGAFAPFWSPDSQYIAFFADKALKKIAVAGGPAEKICDAEALPGGGTWNETGTILFAAGQGGPLFQVPARGGKPQPVTMLNGARFEHAHLWPQFLPDGVHFVFFILSDIGTNTGVYGASLGKEGGAARMVINSATNAVYSEGKASDGTNQGYLLYMRERTLMGVPFDVGRMEKTGEPKPLQDDVGALESLSLAPVSISRTGVLVFQSVGAASRQLAWLDRSGKTVSPVNGSGAWGPPRISPDGTRAVVAKRWEGKEYADLFMIDEAGNATPFTAGPGHKGSPVWSPDGSRIAYYRGVEDGSFDLMVSPANNGSKSELLMKSAQAVYPTDWSRDGKFLLFGVLSQGSRGDIWGMSIADRHAGPLLDTIYSEGYASLSPDGKWLAFQSDESGRNQVYVQPFDGITRGTKRRYDVSTEAGGGLPRWSRDGSELFYLTNTGLMVSVKVHPQGEEFKNDPPEALFQTRPIPATWNLYDVTPDGQRFLMNLPLEWSSASPITVMTNWTEKLKTQ